MIKPIIPFVFLFILACAPKPNTDKTTMESPSVNGSITETSFGKLADGQEVFLYTLTNKNGLEMKATNYGGLIISLKTPDRSGKIEDITLGYDSLSGYLRESPAFGALIGRYANRIARAKFTLDGKDYFLTANNGTNSIHGGKKGFDKVVWKAERTESANGPSLKLIYLSKDIEEGFPGNLNVEVEYALTNNDELKITYRATTDKPTIVNLTQHSYFNLTAGKHDVLDHVMTVNSDSTVEIDKNMIPTGRVRSVKNTALDFTTPRRVGEQIDATDDQVQLGHGYDHCFILRGLADSLRLAATLSEPVSGRMMEVYTTAPGVQIYSGNYLSGSITGKSGVVYKKRFGICFETGLYPDSPNRPEFPSPVLRPGETYRTETLFKFLTGAN